jgi:hypothetical protein
MHLTSLDGLAGSRAGKSSTILVSFWISVMFLLLCHEYYAIVFSCSVACSCASFVLACVFKLCACFVLHPVV